MSQLFAVKPVDRLLAEAREAGEGALTRALGPMNLVALGIGAVIGAGIFVITGSAAAQFAGPAIVISFLLAGLGCAFAGLCYAELASMIPVAGSAYTYGYATLGEIFAWIIGWDLVLEYAFSAATVASGWGATMVSLLQDFGINLPPQFIETPGSLLVHYHGRWEPISTLAPALQAAGVNIDSLPHATGLFNLPACLAVIAVTAILVVGIRQSANFNVAVVFIKVGAVIVFIIIAAAYLWKNPQVAATNWTPFIPPNKGHYGEFGWSGISRGAAVIFFAYIGFDAVSTAAQEAKNPQRDMPIGILGSLAVCTVLYILVAALLTGIVHYPQLNVAAPVAVGIDVAGVRWGSLLVKGGSLAGLSTVMLVTLMGQSRIFYTMSKDGLLPRWASTVHPRFRTPWISTIVVGVAVAVFAGLIPISALGQLVSIGTLFAFIIVCAAVLILRSRRPDLPRAFRTPYSPMTPVLGIVISLYLMLSLPLDTWMRLGAWLLIGVFIYFGYSRRHSRIGKERETRASA
ncbi:MAG: amino acid permease [Acidobacteria bacterium]|nr:amino acid permease [Acidobacteriota bacterium]MCW5968626.1 amino acid permease [Blastocatellales bacterium]